MKIITHPKNKKYLEQIREDFSASVRPMGILPARLDGFEVIFDDLIPAEVPSKTEFVARHHRFCEYNTSDPSDWEIFCGYVAPKMVPNFIMINELRSTFMGKNGPEVR